MLMDKKNPEYVLTADLVIHYIEAPKLEEVWGKPFAAFEAMALILEERRAQRRERRCGY